MCEPIHFCIERILARELNKDIRINCEKGERAIAVKKSMWPNGSNLTICFLQGTPDVHSLVEHVAAEWTRYANLTFDFGANPNAEIRISFDPSLGSWSAVGTDCLNLETFPKTQATMNFAWLDESVVLHEFGHAIGLSHEHLNPEGGIQWNEPVVIQAMTRPPNRWSEQVTRHNIFRKYAFDQINGTVFDPDSIMLYEFPSEWTLNGMETHANSKLSLMDKAFIASQGAYPMPRPVQDDLLVELPLNQKSPISACIGKPGEEDLYFFHVKESGYYQVETLGHTNVYMRLFGPDNRTSLIDEDDDSGLDVNARIIRRLEPGEYLVQIRHSDFSKGTGEYAIRARAI